MRRLSLFIAALLPAAAIFPSGARAGNLHLIEQRADGFAIYRSGTPSRGDFNEWCRLGIQEVMVLSGDEAEHEDVWSSDCPGIRVIFSERQHVKYPLSAQFLEFFDRWVAKAQSDGRKILFRCQCGCHRTGRLAAYYEIRYLRRDLEQSLVNLYAFGSGMQNYPFLPPQIEALQDYASQKPCRFKESDAEKAYCVTP